jgi:hypothetical protein
MNFRHHLFIISEFVHSCVGKEGNMSTGAFSLPTVGRMCKLTLRRSPATIDYLAFFFERLHNQAKSLVGIASSNHKAGASCEPLRPSQRAGVSIITHYYIN